MRAFILAAGRGSRMSGLTDKCPKPMLLVKGRPILEHLIVNAIQAGITDFTIHLGYLGHIISSYFGNGDRLATRIEYFNAHLNSPEESILAFGKMSSEQIYCCLCGDTLLSSQQISRLIQTHVALGVTATFVREHGGGHVSSPVSVLANRVVRSGTGMEDVWVGCNGIVERTFLDASWDIVQTEKVKSISALMTALATQYPIGVADLGQVVNLNTPEQLYLVSNGIEDYE